MYNAIPPVKPVSNQEKHPNEEALRKSRSIDRKVKGVVLDRIIPAKGGLLPLASSPQVVIDLLPIVESGKLERAPRPKRKSKLRKLPLLRTIPIGLQPVDPEGGINALMQFILFVPGFAESFFFAPRSLALFCDFIHQYYHDQQERQSVSTANGRAIFRFFTQKIPDLCLHDLFQFLIHSVQSKWQLFKNLEEALAKEAAADLFVRESSQKKQFFLGNEVGYELDAFIELRPDGVSVNFFAYVKVEGSWYQCDNEQVVQLRSSSLALPLSRAILLHYRRIAFSRRSGWF